MSPIDFVVFDGDSTPDLPIKRVAEAMHKPIRILSEGGEWEVLSYYYSEGQLILDIGEKA